MITLEDYIGLVATKLKEAEERHDMPEVIRLLRVCGVTLVEKAQELELEDKLQEGQ